MAFEKLLVRAARVTWRRRLLWALGLVATAGVLALNLFFRGATWLLGDRVPRRTPDLLGSFEQAIDPARLVAAVVVLLLIGLFFWLISAIAEGGMIVTARSEGGERVVLSQAIRAGVSLVGCFIGIDTLLFLPLFLLALALTLAGFGGLAGLVLVATRPAAQVTDLLLVTGAFALVSVPILILMLVTAVVILVLRALAFRAAALDGLDSRASIRQGWAMARRNFWGVAVLALVLWAIRSVVGMPFRALSLVLAIAGLAQLAAAAAGPSGETTALGLFLALSGILLAFVSWLLSGIMNAYSSASWTLAYEEWTAEPV